MFKIGDVIVYSLHGLSQIDDICEKKLVDETKTCYVLHPLDQPDLTIITPVDNEKVVMLKMMDPGEAKEIVESFRQPGMKWIASDRERTTKFKSLIKTGDRRQISEIANMLMRKHHELNMKQKKLYEQDRKCLKTIQDILFVELAMSLNTTVEKISKKITNMINEQAIS